MFHISLFKKKVVPSPREFTERLKLDSQTYQEDYHIFKGQSDSVKAELRTIKIIMAALIPSFLIFATIVKTNSIFFGIVCVTILSAIFLRKNKLKFAVASLVSVIMGVIFGLWLRYELRGLL
jgi:hypothetical protein